MTRATGMALPIVRATVHVTTKLKGPYVNTARGSAAVFLRATVQVNGAKAFSPSLGSPFGSLPPTHDRKLVNAFLLCCQHRSV